MMYSSAGKDTQSSPVVFDLEYFFELSPDLLCIAGYDGYFKKINPAVSKTLGYTTEELFAAPINTFVHPDDQNITAQKRKHLIKGESLLNFENRYIAKNGAIIWLSWTSVLIKRDKLIFAIGKNITYKKQLEEYGRISAVLGVIKDDQKGKTKKDQRPVLPKSKIAGKSDSEDRSVEISQPDQLWLNDFEMIVRKYADKQDVSLGLISNELAMSERQLFRRVDQILGITPNKLVRIVRLQLAWEGIASGKYRTISEISNIAGYRSRAHFSKLFKEVYGISVSELL